jgi:AcrR family transcriptional regulator
VARWDPGTEQRLTKAALELFREHGYDDVTVAQIAERAGITRRTFFRYFPDKREVLFAGSERLPTAVAEAVLAADPAVAALPAAFAALRAVGTQLVELVDHVAERRAVIAASAELQERERTKMAAVTSAVDDALRQRDVAPGTARLVAQLAVVAFQNAFDRWVDAGGRDDFAACVEAVVTSLRDALAEDPPPYRQTAPYR